LYLFNSI